MTVLAHAGLPPEKQADMWTQDGVVTVDGSTDVTLHVIREKTTTYELRLASLRNEGGKLLLLDTGEKIDLTDISTTEVTVSSPSRNVELILGIAGGSLLLTALIYVVAALQWSRSAGMHQ